ncbi:hypothetical protein GCM10010517_71110 [Streptosporangium fragile]|uniref:Uncharacterized protein n=1 Tax=Streptosporangium fragile TaxID=46186 RepID=A0ABN3WA61_9ACTN
MLYFHGLKTRTCPHWATEAATCSPASGTRKSRPRAARWAAAARPTGPAPISEHFAVEAPLLEPLPAEPFQTGPLLSPRVDRYRQITVRTTATRCPPA